MDEKNDTGAAERGFDPDLSRLLCGCKNDELEPLVAYIVNAETNSLSTSDIYKQNTPNHSAYVPEIVSEFRAFGGNSIVNLFRGSGVPYAEIARDVASKLKAGHDKTDPVEEVERKVLVKVLVDSIAKMSADERQSLEDQFRKAGAKNVDLSVGVPSGVMLAQLGVQMTGFLAYQVGVIVANAVAKLVVGRGLTLAANAALTRVIGVLVGPIGWAVTGAWTAVDLAGPAYRVTIPAVCHIAFLRQARARAANRTLESV